MCYAAVRPGNKNRRENQSGESAGVAFVKKAYVRNL